MSQKNTKEETLNIAEYMKTRVDDQIAWYDKKSLKCQRWYKVFQAIEIFVAASIPVLSGYASKYNAIPLIIGIEGAIITIVESITRLYKFHENWIEYRTTCELLIYQKHLYLTGSAPYNTEPESVENIFVRNIENIISSENNKWKAVNTHETAEKKATN